MNIQSVRKMASPNTGMAKASRVVIIYMIFKSMSKMIAATDRKMNRKAHQRWVRESNQSSSEPSGLKGFIGLFCLRFVRCGISS